MSAPVHPDIAQLVSSGRLPASIAPKVSALEPGVYCIHKSWGVGKVASWELSDDRMIIDFEDRKGHAMKLEFAAKSLDPIPDTHILARRHADAAGLQSLARNDRPALVRAILESHGGSMLLDTFEAVVKPKIVSEREFKNWWEGTKKELRSRPEFIVPSKRNLPLELRAGSLAPHEALIDDFRKARDLKVKARALDAISREIELFQEPAELDAILREADESAAQNLRLRPVEALDLILSRDELRDKVKALHDNTTPALATAVAQEGARLAESVGSLPVTRQRRVFDALVDATGDEGVQNLLPLINRLSQRSIHELAAVLHDKGYSGPLNSFLKLGILHRTLSSDALVWVAKERTGMTADVFGIDFSKALLSAIERDHFDEASRKSNRVTDLLMDDRELIADLITGVELAQARNFARQMMLSPGIDEMGKRSLLARFIRVYPELEELINERAGDRQEEDVLIVSWRSLEEKKKAYDHLVNVEIPKNREDISIARSYGDLRENFEYKSAKEYSRVLQRRRFELERDLNRARGTDFSDATTERVSIGTKVHLEDVPGGAAEAYTILGAWDTNVAEHIISYLSATGGALLGRACGDEVDLPTEDSSGTRRVRVTGIELADVSQYAQGPKDAPAGEDSPPPAETSGGEQPGAPADG